MINHSFFRYPYHQRLDKLIGISKSDESDFIKLDRIQKFITEEIYLDAPSYKNKEHVMNIALAMQANLEMRDKWVFISELRK